MICKTKHEPLCNKCIFGLLQALHLLWTKTKNVSRTYENPTLKGEINYAKFNKEHNESLLKVLKDEGYKVSVTVK